MKTCCQCFQNLPDICFGVYRRSSDGLRGECRECRKRENESARERSNRNYAANREKLLADMSAYYQQHKEEKRAYGRRHYELNKVKYLLAATTRKKHVARATPVWVDEEEQFLIGEAYELAKLRTEMLGYRWVVDHYYPLRGKTVCGLHTIENLRVIPDRENNWKRAKHPDTFYARAKAK